MPKKGYKQTSENRKSIKNSGAGQYVRTKEIRKKQSLKMIGRCVSPATCFKKGQVSWRTGLTSSTSLKVKRSGEKQSKTKRSDEWFQSVGKKVYQKISEAKLGKTWETLYGKKKADQRKEVYQKMTSLSGNPNWLGGRSFTERPHEWNETLREQVRERDGHRCQQCFRHESELHFKNGQPCKLSVHHIDYNKKNNKPSNLISLCASCHIQTNYSRKDWEKYFKERVS
jgi:nitrate/TMAO reductase-like tetraheme cytochrome c subunit